MFEFLGTTQGKIATTAGLGVAVLLGLYFYSCTSSTPSSVSARDKASNAAPQAPMKAEKPASDAKAQTASNSDASESARPTPDMATEGLGPSTSPSTTRVQAPETSTAPRGLDLRSGDPTPAPLVRIFSSLRNLFFFRFEFSAVFFEAPYPAIWTFFSLF